MINNKPAQMKTADTLELRYLPRALDADRLLSLDRLDEDMCFSNERSFSHNVACYISNRNFFS